MYIRNDGKGESNITQNGFTAYLLSAVAHRKADYTLFSSDARYCRICASSTALIHTLFDPFACHSK